MWGRQCNYHNRGEGKRNLRLDLRLKLYCAECALYPLHRLPSTNIDPYHKFRSISPSIIRRSTQPGPGVTQGLGAGIQVITGDCC